MKNDFKDQFSINSDGQVCFRGIQMMFNEMIDGSADYWLNIIKERDTALIEWAEGKRGLPTSYSYYIASTHNKEDESMDTLLHSQKGYCPNCGHWKQVWNISEIPENLRDIDNPLCAIKKHYEGEGKEILSDLINYFKGNL